MLISDVILENRNEEKEMKKRFIMRHRGLILILLLLFLSGYYSSGVYADQWAKAYGGNNGDSASSIQQTSDGGYIVAGYTKSFGAGILDFWVLKLDPTGSIPECPLGVASTATITNTTVTGGNTTVAGVATTVTPAATTVTPSDTDCSIETQCYAFPGTISFSPPSFTFSATQGGPNPPSQTLEIWNSGEDTLNWSVSHNPPWLNLLPESGSSTGEHDAVTVSVNIWGMSAGNYSGNITISAPGATNTPQTVPVSLTVNPPSCENNPLPAAGFASISDKMVIAYGYKFGEGTGGWTVYNPAWAATHPEWNTLTMLHRGRGYWIKVSQACTLVYGTNTYSLDADWNLIAWLGC